jgi:hypothetical protein
VHRPCGTCSCGGQDSRSRGQNVNDRAKWLIKLAAGRAEQSASARRSRTRKRKRRGAWRPEIHRWLPGTSSSALELRKLTPRAKDPDSPARQCGEWSRALAISPVGKSSPAAQVKNCHGRAQTPSRFTSPRSPFSLWRVLLSARPVARFATIGSHPPFKPLTLERTAFRFEDLPPVSLFSGSRQRWSRPFALGD